MRVLTGATPNQTVRARRRWWHRVFACLQELLLIAAAYAFYAWVRGYVGAKTSASDSGQALNNGERVVSVERALGLFREASVQRAILGWPWLMRALDTFWSYAYLVVTLATIVWLLVRHIDRFGPLRTAFFVTTIVSVGIFALFPTVPPRMLPSGYGIVDTWSTLGGLTARHPPRIEHISDAYASIPSLHVAWSVWCAVAVAAVTQRRWARWAAWLYPLLTVLAVVATGNHYFLDCLSGALLMLVAIRYAPAMTAALPAVRARAVAWRYGQLGLGDEGIAQVLAESQDLD